MDALQQFVADADAFAMKAGITRSAVSKRLFSSSRKLDELASGKVDVGYLRLKQAVVDLQRLTAELQAAAPADPPPDRVEA